MTSRWTTPDDIASRVRRRWDDGTLLRAYATSAPFDIIDMPVRGPRASEIGDDLAAVQVWIAPRTGRRDDRRYKLQWTTVGGRHIGRNEVPARAIVSSFDQAWALLGVNDSVRWFDEVLAMTGDHPAVHQWVTASEHEMKVAASAFASADVASAWSPSGEGSPAPRHPA